MRLPRLAIVTLLAMTTASCGAEEVAGPAERSPASILAAALKRSESAESYKSSFAMRSDLGGERVSMSGTARSTADSMRLRGDFTYREGDRKPVRLEMILIDDEAFYSSDDFGKLPRGLKWLRLQDDSFTQQSLTPKQFVDLLRETPKVEEAGREVVRGERAIRLRGPLDIDALADKVGEGPAVELLRRSDIADEIDLTIQAWVSERDDRLLRNELRLTAGRAAEGTMVFTGDILEEDVPLDDVVAPPDRQVLDEKAFKKG